MEGAPPCGGPARLHRALTADRFPTGDAAPPEPCCLGLKRAELPPHAVSVAFFLSISVELNPAFNTNSGIIALRAGKPTPDIS